jgi:kynureninase
MFHFPQHEGKDVIYFCGNSLGLQPKTVESAIQIELNSWREKAVGGYFSGTHPWLYYHELLTPSLSKLVGAQTKEITITNTLTVNLHLLLLSFYKPNQTRFKILMEEGVSLPINMR